MENQEECCNKRFKSLMDGKMHKCIKTGKNHIVFKTPHMAITKKRHVVFSALNYKW